MKKTLIVCLTLLLVVAIATGCQAETAEPSMPSTTNEIADETVDSDATAQTKYQPKPFKLFYPFPDTGSKMFSIAADNVKHLVELANGEFVSLVLDSYDTDAQISYVEKQISAGAGGVVFSPFADTAIPTVCNMCNDAEVPWALSMRVVRDIDTQAMMEASPYYIGSTSEDEEQAGYEVMKHLNSLGLKKIAIISQPKGDYAGDTREAGIQRACEEFGMSIVAEARGIYQVSDAATSVESFLSSHTDLDAIYAVSYACPGLVEACIKKIQESGNTHVKFACQDIPDDIVNDFNTGVLVCVNSSAGYNGATFDYYLTVVKLINEIQGYPIRNENGGCANNTLRNVMITNADDAQRFLETCFSEGYRFFTDDYIEANLFGWNNADLDEAGLQAIIDSNNPLG